MTRKMRISATAWPWGRTSPGQRAADIRRMIDKNLAQIPIIEDQAREAIRRIRLNNDALNEQLGVAEKFIQEEARAENKRLAYELSDYGIDKISQVDAESDQVSLGDSLRELLKKARNESSTTEEDLDSFLNSMKE
jgi:hypothetical protein